MDKDTRTNNTIRMTCRSAACLKDKGSLRPQQSRAYTFVTYAIALVDRWGPRIQPRIRLGAKTNRKACFSEGGDISGKRNFRDYTAIHALARRVVCGL